METAETTERLLAALASAERELARRRAAAATEFGMRARPWWDTPRACVAMLARHEGASTLVSDALARTPVARWEALFPALDGHPTDTLRAARAQWARELAALARGEVVSPTAVPPRAPAAPPPLGAPAPEPPPATAPLPREPRSAPRDTSPEANAARLERWLDGVFGAPRMREDEAPAEAPLEVHAWYEVAPRGDGRLALWLVCAPTAGFAPFVKVLTVRCGPWERAVRRENLTALGARFELAPSGEPPAWTTGDAEDDASFTPVLTSLTPNALATERPTVFRTDVTGASQRVTGMTLAAGARYLVLLPPGPTAPARGEVTTLDGGWRLWSVDVPVVADEALAAAIDALGLSVGPAALDATWILTPPRRWELTARGDRVPVFATEDLTFVRVSSGVSRGDMVAFLWGGDGLKRLPIATTERVDVALGLLEPGRYVFEVTAEDRAVSAARLAFVVDEDLRGGWPVHAPVVRLGDRVMKPGEALEADLSSLGDALPWSITAPPAAPVRVRWEGGSSWDAGWLAADETGAVDLAAVNVRTRTIRESAALGALTVDLGEWGVVRVAHARTASLALPAARLGLRGAMEAAAAFHGAGIADPQLAAALWGRPVAAALGYSARELPVEAWRACQGLSVLLLDAVEVTERGFRVRAVSLLALLHPSLGLRAREEGTARATLDAIGGAVDVPRAIVSDGRRWWALELARTAPPMADMLDAVLEDDEGLEGFLVRYGAWR